MYGKIEISIINKIIEGKYSRKQVLQYQFFFGVFSWRKRSTFNMCPQVTNGTEDGSMLVLNGSVTNRRWIQNSFPVRHFNTQY